MSHLAPQPSDMEIIAQACTRWMGCLDRCLTSTHEIDTCVTRTKSGRQVAQLEPCTGPETQAQLPPVDAGTAAQAHQHHIRTAGPPRTSRWSGWQQPGGQLGPLRPRRRVRAPPVHVLMRAECDRGLWMGVSGCAHARNGEECVAVLLCTEAVDVFDTCQHPLSTMALVCWSFAPAVLPACPNLPC